MNNTILQFKGIGKSFPGVKALDNVSFEIKKGHVHALMGENGAGKSTLIKLLAGIYTNYEGEIYLDGELLKLRTPNDAQKHGISVVHQEIKLAETLSITENIFLGNLIYKKGLVDWKEMKHRAQAMVEGLGMDLEVDMPVNQLTVAKKQIVEICKAINHDCKVLIMDEPSATLTEKELKILFGIMDKLIKDGITIIYISHRMEEIFNLANTITVLRDGKHIDTLPVKECDRKTLIKLMVGRSIGNEYPKEEIDIGDVILKAEHLTRKKVFKDISFELRKGEILGFSGLVGAGRTEVMRALVGIDHLDSGAVYLKGKKILIKSFQNAIANGLGLIPEDRRQQGLVQIAPVKENICMVGRNKVTRHGLIQASMEKDMSKHYVDKLDIATPNIETEVQYLSGGNQQKVVIAKWLLEDSEIIIMDEPTRGIDVGAKSEIYRLMCALVKQGKSIIMISSELPELLGMCDRIMVMHEGKLVGEMAARKATQEKIMELCT
ncbi:MAG TPA: sugar ABC transporter ATP-binding protein [Clostridiales bacterium]|nr:sugar ABC transporter ATP-binding protein [Clostridiales bacterium]